MNIDHTGQTAPGGAGLGISASSSNTQYDGDVAIEVFETNSTDFVYPYIDCTRICQDMKLQLDINMESCGGDREELGEKVVEILARARDDFYTLCPTPGHFFSLWAFRHAQNPTAAAATGANVFHTLLVWCRSFPDGSREMNSIIDISEAFGCKHSAVMLAFGLYGDYRPEEEMQRVIHELSMITHILPLFPAGYFKRNHLLDRVIHQCATLRAVRLACDRDEPPTQQFPSPGEVSAAVISCLEQISDLDQAQQILEMRRPRMQEQAAQSSSSNVTDSTAMPATGQSSANACPKRQAVASSSNTTPSRSASNTPPDSLADTTMEGETSQSSKRGRTGSLAEEPERDRSRVKVEPPPVRSSRDVGHVPPQPPASPEDHVPCLNCDGDYIYLQPPGLPLHGSQSSPESPQENPQENRQPPIPASVLLEMGIHHRFGYFVDNFHNLLNSDGLRMLHEMSAQFFDLVMIRLNEASMPVLTPPYDQTRSSLARITTPVPPPPPQNIDTLLQAVASASAASPDLPRLQTIPAAYPPGGHENIYEVAPGGPPPPLLPVSESESEDVDALPLAGEEAAQQAYAHTAQHQQHNQNQNQNQNQRPFPHRWYRPPPCRLSTPNVHTARNAQNAEQVQDLLQQQRRQIRNETPPMSPESRQAALREQEAKRIREQAPRVFREYSEMLRNSIEQRAEASASSSSTSPAAAAAAAAARRGMPSRVPLHTSSSRRREQTEN